MCFVGWTNRVPDGEPPGDGLPNVRWGTISLPMGGLVTRCDEPSLLPVESKLIVFAREDLLERSVLRDIVGLVRPAR